jgi:hypothetical protein
MFPQPETRFFVQKRCVSSLETGGQPPDKAYSDEAAMFSADPMAEG